MRRLALGALALVSIACACAQLPEPEAQLSVPVSALQAEIAANGRTVAIVTLRRTARSIEPASASGGPRSGFAGRGGGAGGAAHLIEAQLDPRHVATRHRFESFPGLVVSVDAEGLAALAAHPDVEALSPDLRIHATLAQSVPLIRADKEVAQNGHNGANVTVAVLDSGVNGTHMDLASAIIGTGYHSLNQGQNAGAGGWTDDNGHGTNVAGVVASRGNVGSPGVAPGAHIFPVKVLDASGAGWLSDWAIGVDYVVAHRTDVMPPIRVINMSLVSTAQSASCPCDADNAAFARSAAAAKSAGIAIFASSGNGGFTQQMGLPACFSTVTAVGATYDASYGPSPMGGGTYYSKFGSEFADCSETSQPAAFACFTSRNPCLKLLAPGAAIQSDYIPGNAEAVYYGTSQASPHAAGVAADILSAYPSLTADQVYRAVLTSSRTPIADPANASRTYVFLDALDADAFAQCEATCTPTGACDQPSCTPPATCGHAPLSPGTACGSTCAAGSLTLSTCNAAGTCVAQAPRACAPYACDPAGDACLTACTADSQCAAGKACSNGACGDPPGGCSVAAGRPASAAAWFLLGVLIVCRSRRRWRTERDRPRRGSASSPLRSPSRPARP